jgi:lysozyme
MPKIKVIDLSHYNVIPESLEPAYGDGVRGVIHKCTEGTSYFDSKVEARFALARQCRGMSWGLYHFLRPGDMQAQAEFFWAMAQTVSDDRSLLAADYEVAEVSLDDLADFLEAIETLSGRSPVIYSGHVLKDKLGGKANARLEGYRLWLAQYSSTPTLPVGFDSYYLWQYSDGDAGPTPHSVAGVNDPVDCNDYQGSDEELRATWAGSQASTIEPPRYPIERPPSTDKPNVELTGIIIVKTPSDVIVKHF